MNALTNHSQPIRRANTKAVVLLGLHTVVFAVVYWFAFFIRNDFTVQGEWLPTYFATVSGVVAVKLVIFYWLGHCHVSWRRIAFSDLTALIWAATLAMLVVTSIEGLILSTGRFGDFPRVPRSVIVLDWAGTVLAIGGIRALWRSIREELRPIFTSKPIRTALIVGADEAGELLARTLVSARNSQYFVAGFLDDDPGLLHNRVAGLEVLGTIDAAGQEVERRRIDEVMVRSGSLTGSRFRKLLEDCVQAGAGQGDARHRRIARGPRQPLAHQAAARGDQGPPAPRTCEARQRRGAPAHRGPHGARDGRRRVDRFGDLPAGAPIQPPETALRGAG